MSVDDGQRQRALAANIRYLKRKLSPAEVAAIRGSDPIPGGQVQPPEAMIIARFTADELHAPSVADPATVPAVPPAPKADPVGLQEIIERLGVGASSPRQWRYRGIFPEPDYESINGLQAWEWETILRWAGATGRLGEGTGPYEEFVERFGSKPLERRVGGSMTAEQKARSEKLLHARKKKT